MISKMKNILFGFNMFLIFGWGIYIFLPTILLAFKESNIYLNGIITQYQSLYTIILIASLLFWLFIFLLLKIKNMKNRIAFLIVGLFFKIIFYVLLFILWTLIYTNPKVEFIDGKKYIVETEHINFAKYKECYYEEINWLYMKKVKTN